MSAGAAALPAASYPLPPREAERVAELRRYGILGTPPEEPFEHIVRIAARLLRAPIALVSLVEEDRQWLKARVGLEACGTPRDVAFCAHAIAAPEPLLVVPTRAAIRGSVATRSSRARPSSASTPVRCWSRPPATGSARSA